MLSMVASEELRQIISALAGGALPSALALLEGLNEGVFLTRTDDTILYANLRMLDLTGYAPEELVGEIAYRLLLPPEAWDPMRERNRRRTAGVAESYEVEIVRRDGSRCWVEARASPVFDADGRVIATLSANTDISLRKRAEGLLRQTAIEDERRRVAREIHDTLAQAFAGIAVQLGAAERVVCDDPAAAGEHIGRARELAREGLREARRSVWALHPEALERNTLGEALAELIRSMGDASMVQVRFNETGIAAPISPETALHLLRIGQEALTNAVRHADAGSIEVELAYLDDANVRLMIRDDGRGFEPAWTAGGSGLGLRGMKERAARLGADISIESRRGSGTTVQVITPIKPGFAGA